MKLFNPTRRFFNNITRWFSYLPVAWRVYDFDYTSILAMERHQIMRVRDSIVRYRHHVNWHQDVASINLALKLLDIIEEDNGADLIGDDYLIFNKDHTITFNPDCRWQLDKYVNIRNARRFYPEMELECYENTNDGAIYRGHLRVEKAWHLYHKLRLYKLRGWWD